MSIYKRIPIAMNKGRAILEYDGSMCRITLSLQDIPTDKLCTPYLLWEDSFMPLPKPLSVDGSGRCSLRCEVKAENPVKIKAVVVTGNNLECIDIGYIGEKYNWQKCFMAEEETLPSKPKEENTEQKPVESTQNSESTEEKPPETEKKEVFKSIVCRLGEDIKELKEYANMPDTTEHLFESRQGINPFYGCEGKWIKISLKELALAGSLWKYINNPLALYACRKYHHLILGRGTEGLMLGIPWEYDPEYRLEAGIQGFNIIKPVENTAPQRGTMCYLITIV